MKEKKSQTILVSTWEEIEFNLYIPFIRDKDNKPFVFFNYLNPDTNKKKKIVKSAKLDRNGDVKILKKQAKFLADALIDLLKGGWNPITNSYNDLPITPLSNISECMEYWLKTRIEAAKLEAIGAKALKSNEYLMEFFNTWLKSKSFAFRKPNTFTYLDIDNFLQTTAKDRKWGKVSYNCYRGDLSLFFKLLVTQKIITDNPVTLSEKKNIKNDSSRFVIFEEDELKNVVGLLANDEAFKELYIAAKLLFFLNVRPIEITRIQVYNLDFEKKILWLEPVKTKNHNEAKWELTDELFTLLEDYVGNNPKNYFVFANHNTPKAVQAHKDFLGQRWRAFRIKYNISSHLKFYALKHSSDWHDLESGVGIQAISERNRHANPNVTVAYIEQRLNKKIIKPSQSKMF